MIEEIQGLSGEPLHVYIKSLERVLAARLELQGERLDTQHDDIRALSARIEKQGEQIGSLGNETGSLRAEIRAQSAQLDAQDTKRDALGDKIDAQNKKIDAQNEKIDAQNEKIDAQNEKIDAQRAETRALHEKLVEQIESLRREHRIVLGVLMLLATLGIFGWFTQSCSRRVEPNGGVGASQTIPEPREVTPSSPAAPPGPSAESLETDETAEVEGERPASDPDVTR